MMNGLPCVADLLECEMKKGGDFWNGLVYLLF